MSGRRMRALPGNLQDSPPTFKWELTASLPKKSCVFNITQLPVTSLPTWGNLSCKFHQSTDLNQHFLLVELEKLAVGEHCKLHMLLHSPGVTDRQTDRWKICTAAMNVSHALPSIPLSLFLFLHHFSNSSTVSLLLLLMAERMSRCTGWNKNRSLSAAII